MNVIVVADSASMTGGMQKCAIAEAVGFTRRGHHVSYLAGYGPPDATLRHEGVETVCFGYDDVPARHDRGAALKRVVGNAEAVDALRALLAGKSPKSTVVHVHDVDRIITTRVISEARSSGFPVVMTLHTYTPSCPTGSFYDFREGEICGRRPQSLACCTAECTAHGWPTKVGHMAKHWMSRRRGIPEIIQHLIFVSEFSLRIHQPHLPRGASASVIANPIDVERAEPVHAAANQFFTYVGRLVPEKGPELLAAAAREADVPVRFVGEGVCADAVMAANPKAEITGWVESAKVASYLRESRALCMVSRWYETLGLVVPEALGRGVPVVTADTCAATDLVTDGVNGLHFRSGDVADLAAKLKLLGSDELVLRLSRQAYDHYWERAGTLDEHLDAVEAIYRKVLSG